MTNLKKEKDCPECEKRYELINQALLSQKQEFVKMINKRLDNYNKKLTIEIPEEVQMKLSGMILSLEELKQKLGDK